MNTGMQDAFNLAWKLEGPFVATADRRSLTAITQNGIRSPRRSSSSAAYLTKAGTLRGGARVVRNAIAAPGG